MGWPSPVEADSGNGAHLLYAIDLPNDPPSADLLRRCLYALAFQFSDEEAEVDCTTFNAARICKVYGTLSCKGDDTPDRPHRLSRVLSAPVPMVRVSKDVLEALAAMLPPEQAKNRKARCNGQASKFDLVQWIRDHNLPVVATGPWKQGGWRWILNPCPWNPDHDNRAAFIVQWPDGAIGAGCHHNSCADKNWHALRDLLEPDWRERSSQGSCQSRNGSQPPSVNSTSPDSDRPAIVITTEEHLVNDEAVESLARDQILFQRGGLLVRIIPDASPVAKGIRRPSAPRIDPLPPALLRERMAANALWVEASKREEEPARPPAWSVAAVHVRANYPGIRHLDAVVDYPVFRPDGTILSAPGYDPETGLWLEPAGVLPQVPDRPTQRDAVNSWHALSEVVADFPFARDCHRAAWLAALLTPLARFAYPGPAPLFLADSNVRAAGKGLLLDCVSRIVTGERFTIATYTRNEDELRKRITSLALAGDRLVLLDNLSGEFGNPVLDAALTGTVWKDRLLGGNRMVEAPLHMTWYATGNNVAIGADTPRRVCHIRLESPEEKPEERKDFRHKNLLMWVGQEQSRLLASALTILRAYFVAGCPDLGLPAWGSFEGWSNIVRSSVVWVGLPDPAETRLLLQDQADVAAEHMALLLLGWEKLDPERQGITTAQVIHQLYKEPRDPPPDFHADLKEALESLLDKLDARALGNKLRTYRRRVFRGRFFDQTGTKHHAARWAVYPADAFHDRATKTPRSPQTHTDGQESSP
jgi:hypothetical protein